MIYEHNIVDHKIVKIDIFKNNGGSCASELIVMIINFSELRGSENRNETYVVLHV